MLKEITTTASDLADAHQAALAADVRATVRTLDDGTTIATHPNSALAHLRHLRK